MEKDELIQKIIDFLDWKGFIVGLVGGLAMVMYRANKGILKGKLEVAYILFIGSFFTAFGTKPAMLALQYYLPEVKNLDKVNDLMALVIGVSGWAIVDFLIMDLPGLLKRWIYKQMEFVKDEVKPKDNAGTNID